MNYRISGRLIEQERGIGLMGLVVSAFDKDLLFDDQLGETESGPDGSFEITYAEDEFQELFDQKPDIYLKIRTKDGEDIWSTEYQTRFGANSEEFFKIAIPRSALPDEVVPPLAQVKLEKSSEAIQSQEFVSEIANPSADPAYQLPVEEDVEKELSNVELLIQEGKLGQAVLRAKQISLNESPFKQHYQFLIQGKISKSYQHIGDWYYQSGDVENAQKFYNQALDVHFADEDLNIISKKAVEAFDEVVAVREELLGAIVNAIEEDAYDQWCKIKDDLNKTSIFNSDKWGEYIKKLHIVAQKPRIPNGPPLEFGPDPVSFVTPIAPEAAGLSENIFINPGSAFNLAGDVPDAIDVSIKQSPIFYTVAMPLASQMVQTKIAIHNIRKGLGYTGDPASAIPLFRYEYLRDVALRLVGQVQRIEDRIYPLHFKVDDIAVEIEKAKRNLDNLTQEINAINQEITDWTKSLETTVKDKKIVDGILPKLDELKDDCDIDWWEVAVGVLSLAGLALALIFLPEAEPAAEKLAKKYGPDAAGEIWDRLNAGSVIVEYWSEREVNCDNVDRAIGDMKKLSKLMSEVITEAKAKITSLLNQRDHLSAQQVIMTAELKAVKQSEEKRSLNMAIMNQLLATYGDLRYHFLQRATRIARMMEEAYNFQTDGAQAIIQASYYDNKILGFTAAEKLKKDIEEFDYIQITGRKRKSVQLTQTVHLPWHYTVSFRALLLGGSAVFTTQMEHFDHWYPGTYLQRLKEVKVEVYVDGVLTPVQGYLSNLGSSFVRFRDPGNKVKIDNVHVFGEKDDELVKLCFKRLQRSYHNETMAFPLFESPLADERGRQLQDRERNFFENVGLESTWKIELLPDQPFNLAHITDVRLIFQYEAMFDETLKSLMESKRFDNRSDVSLLSIKNILTESGGSFSLPTLSPIIIAGTMFQYPHIEKTIKHVGFMIKRKNQAALGEAVNIQASFQNEPAVTVTTDEQGLVVTGGNKTAGTNTTALMNMCQGKNVEGDWSVQLQLPPTLQPDVIEDVLLMLNYEYAP